MPAKVLIIAGVSGSGKSTVSDAIMARHPNVVRAVSVTTRLPREGERYAYHYYFVDKIRFAWLIDSKQLLEHTAIYGDQYGTLLLSVEQALENGKDVLFVVDIEGVRQIKKAYSNACSVFLAAPSEEEQRVRLEGRGTTGKDLDLRVKEAQKELNWAKKEGMEIVINEVAEEAIRQVEKLFSLL